MRHEQFARYRLADVSWEICVREERFGPNVRLVLGDCREALGTVCGVDAIITDPVWPNAPAGSITGADDPFGLWRAACATMPEHKRIVVVMRCDSDPRFLQVCRGPFFRLMILPYVIPGYLGRVLGGDEIAYWFGASIATGAGRMVVPGRGPSVQPGGRQPNGHPMSRAQRHFDWLVYWASDSAEHVVDPFMGSGTTGVAAIRNSRAFTGIEIDQRWFDIACRRVEAELAAPRLDMEPRARDLHPTLFASAS